MSAFDREKWETRYRTGRGCGNAAPHPFLDRVAARHLPTEGRAIDVAGGVGRHARWLARRGLKTTLLDISERALELGTARATAEGLTLDTLAADLDAGFPSGPWSVVLVSYFLARGRWSDIVAQLAPGGWLVVIHPTTSNLQRHARPSAVWLLEDGELDPGIDGLHTVHHEESWVDDRHEVRFVGQKAP